MNNEATIEILGDTNESMAVSQLREAADTDEAADEGHLDCTSGVCVLNWKPHRPNAA